MMRSGPGEIRSRHLAEAMETYPGWTVHRHS